VLIPVGSFVNLWGIDYTFTLRHYVYIWNLGIKPIVDTTVLSLISMPITGVLGMIIAFLIVRKRFVGRGLIEFVSLLSLAIPGTVIGMGYVLAYNQPPLILTGTGTIIVLSFVFRSMPVGIRAGVASLQQIDPAIEEAAQDLGASSFKVFHSVTIPAHQIRLLQRSGVQLRPQHDRRQRRHLPGIGQRQPVNRYHHEPCGCRPFRRSRRLLHRADRHRADRGRHPAVPVK
jgi:ABC-type Fe3+ transport system permease subunit